MAKTWKICRGIWLVVENMMIAITLKSKLDELSHLNRALTKGDIDSIPEDIQS